MNWKEALRKCEWIVPAILVVGSFFVGSWHGQRKILATIESHTDTVVKVVTVYKDFPEPQKEAVLGHLKVPVYKFIADTVDREKTVVLRDTTVQYVYLPREQKYYNEADGKLRIWVSGYEPRLDRYELDLPTTTITATKAEKASRWGIGISGGYGFAMNGRSPVFSPYLGIGVTYTILRL